MRPFISRGQALQTKPLQDEPRRYNSFSKIISRCGRVPFPCHIMLIGGVLTLDQQMKLLSKKSQDVIYVLRQERVEFPVLLCSGMGEAYFFGMKGLTID